MFRQPNKTEKTIIKTTNVCHKCKADYYKKSQYFKVEGEDYVICHMCKYAAGDTFAAEIGDYINCRYDGYDQRKKTCDKIYKKTEMNFCREVNINEVDWDCIRQHICETCLLERLMEEGDLSCSCEICTQLQEQYVTLK